MTFIMLLALTVIAACSVVLLVRCSWIVAQPDEWLLRVRNGKVIDAGIGISIWRRPGDVVARFSSTIQRVRFSVEAFSSEHLTIVVDGFILWSVASDVDRAFRAFSKLGIANLNHPPSTLKSRSHLLTSSQHHAFQALLAAEVRAHLSSLSLSEILTGPHKLLGSLSERLATLSEALGIVIERTELLQVQPADKNLLHDLAARSEEGVREEAANARLEAADRLRQRQAEALKRQANEDAEVRLAKVEGNRQVALREVSVRPPAPRRRSFALDSRPARGRRASVLERSPKACSGGATWCGARSIALEARRARTLPLGTRGPRAGDDSCGIHDRARRARVSSWGDT